MSTHEGNVYTLPIEAAVIDRGVRPAVKRTLREHGFTSADGRVFWRRTTTVVVGDYGNWRMITDAELWGYGAGRLDQAIRQHA